MNLIEDRPEKKGGNKLILAEDRPERLMPNPSETLSQPREKTFAEQTVGNISAIVPRPPMASEDFNPLKTRAAQFLENKGKGVKETVQQSIGNIVSSPPPQFLPQNAADAYQMGRAALGTIASVGTDLAPFTPSEFAIMAGGELAPTVLPINKITGALPEAIGNKFLNTSNRILKKGIANETESLGTSLVKSPELTGSRQSMLNKSRMLIENTENKIQNAVASSNATVNKNSLVEGIDKTIEALSKTGTNGRDVSRLTRFKNEFLAKQPDEIPIQLANQIKRQYYRNVGDLNYLKDKTSVLVGAEKTVANAIKNAIEDKLPNIADLNADQGKYIAIRDSLINALPKEAKSITSAIGGDLTDQAYLAGARTLAAIPQTRGIGVLAESLLDRLKEKKKK